MSLFGRNNNYESTSDSETCGHPNMSQHDATDEAGNTVKVAYCKSCGMEWK